MSSMEPSRDEEAGKSGHADDSCCPPAQFSWFRELCKMALVLFPMLLDYFMDGIQVYKHYLAHEYGYLCCNLAFVFPPLLVAMFTNIRQFRRGSRSAPAKHLILCLVFTLIFPLAITPRIMSIWHHGRRLTEAEAAGRHRDAKKQFDLMSKALRYVKAFCLMEAFLETAPQHALTVYILANNSPSASLDDAFQIAAKTLSVISIGYQVASSRQLRQFHGFGEDKESNWLGTLVLTLAHALSIAAECIVLALVGWFALLFAVFHVIFFLKVSNEKTNPTAILIHFFGLLLAIVSVFSYPHTTKRFSYEKYLLLRLLESALMIYCYVASDGEKSILWLIISGALAISSMLLFFLFYKQERKMDEWANHVKNKKDDWLDWLSSTMPVFNYLKSKLPGLGSYEIVRLDETESENELGSSTTLINDRAQKDYSTFRVAVPVNTGNLD